MVLGLQERCFIGFFFLQKGGKKYPHLTVAAGYMFFSFCSLKNQIHAFSAFLSLQKINSCFLSFSKLAKNQMHVFFYFKGSFLGGGNEMNFFDKIGCVLQ